MFYQNIHYPFWTWWSQGSESNFPSFLFSKPWFFLARLSSAFSNSLCLMCHLSMSQACYAGTLNTRIVPHFENFWKECFIFSIGKFEISFLFICRCHGHTQWYKVFVYRLFKYSCLHHDCIAKPSLFWNTKATTSTWTDWNFFAFLETSALHITV